MASATRALEFSCPPPPFPILPSWKHPLIQFPEEGQSKQAFHVFLLGKGNGGGSVGSEHNKECVVPTISPAENFPDFEFEVFQDKQNVFLIDSMFIEHLYKAPTAFWAPWEFLRVKRWNRHYSCPQGTHRETAHKQMVPARNDEWAITYKVLREHLKGRNHFNLEIWGRLHTRAEILNNTSCRKV